MTLDLNIPMPERVKKPPRSRFLPLWACRDKVYIDEDMLIVAVVTGMMFGEGGFEQLKLEWFANGDAKSAWIDSWRVLHAG